MVKVCLVSHGHPAANPRLVREADALYQAGHEVSVVTPRFVPRWVEFDEEIVRRGGWHHEYVDFLADSHRGSWQLVRARRRLSHAIFNVIPWEGIVGRACNYANPEIARVAARSRAHLYVAHQHHALPAAAWAARRVGARFAFDAEDLLADSSAEPQALFRKLEELYLSQCAYISTMSAAAARRLAETNRLSQPVHVLHNAPRLSERGSLVPPASREACPQLRLYWFGQTIGPHSCAEQVLKALPLIEKPATLTLRGAASADYIQHIKAVASELGLAGRLEILPLQSPDTMVSLAAQHDIMLGTQPGNELFHQMALGNKVFTGMMAGLALALTDTIAHRELLASAPGCGFLFADGNPRAFADQLNVLLKQDGALGNMKQASWNYAENEFNWDVEFRSHLRRLEDLVKGQQ